MISIGHPQVSPEFTARSKGLSHDCAELQGRATQAHQGQLPELMQHLAAMCVDLRAAGLGCPAASVHLDTTNQPECAVKLAGEVRVHVAGACNRVQQLSSLEGQVQCVGEQAQAALAHMEHLVHSEAGGRDEALAVAEKLQARVQQLQAARAVLQVGSCAAQLEAAAAAGEQQQAPQAACGGQEARVSTAEADEPQAAAGISTLKAVLDVAKEQQQALQKAVDAAERRARSFEQAAEERRALLSEAAAEHGRLVLEARESQALLAQTEGDMQELEAKLARVQGELEVRGCALPFNQDWKLVVCLLECVASRAALVSLLFGLVYAWNELEMNA